MPEQINNAVIEKIKKLFALAQRHVQNDGSSNEAEASAAMAKAQDLLTKYNLDLRTIQDSAKTDPTKRELGKREKVQINRSAMYRWQQEFWSELAQANYCFHWVNTEYLGWRRKIKRHVILGSEVNVTAVQVMGEYLTEVMERILPYPNTERLSKAALSWREGCAERLIERIKERAKQVQEEGLTLDGSSCTALAVRDMAAEEYEANYDARWGDGAWKRHQEWEAEWVAGRPEREKRYAEQRKAEEDHLAEEAAALAEERAKETPEQRAKREAKEAKQAEKLREKQERADARAYRAYQNRRWREMYRLDHNAYKAGKKAANDINLNDQLKNRDQSCLK